MSLHWHLAIESSGLGGSVSLFRSFETLAAESTEYASHEPFAQSATAKTLAVASSAQASTQLQCQIVLPPDGGSVSTLAPAIEDLLKRHELRVRDLSFLSITVGPGSFTGLRVGLATAKMLALAANLQIVPIDTLQLIAERFRLARHKLCPTDGSRANLRLITAINAFRRQLFSASWIINADDRLHNIAAASVVDASDWQADPWHSTLRAASPAVHRAEINAQSIIDANNIDATNIDANMIGANKIDARSKLWITGPRLSVYQPQHDASTASSDNEPTASCCIAPAEIWPPMSEQMGSIAWAKYALGMTCTAADLTPNYIRSSAAEEKANRGA